MTGPLGGQLAYTYINVYRPVETETVVMRSIAERRTVSGETQGTWSFAYTEGDQQNTTVISTPCGQRETYTYHGIGTLGPGGDYSGWLVGALQRSTTETSTGTVLEERLFGWIPSAVVSDNTMLGLPSGHWTSPDVFHAIVSGTQTNRGGHIWKSTHSYHSTRYNDVFQPYQIETWDATPPEPPGGRPRRVTTTTFWDQAASSLYRPAVPAGGTVTVGSESLSHSRSFDATTGFVTSTTGAGMTTTYTRTTTGNVASVTDAANKTTNFTYTWGVPDAITPAIAALKTTRTINPDGTVAQEAFGTSTPLTTASTYDALMRPIAVQPPGGTTPTSLAYEPNGADPGGVVYIETGRGTHAVRLYPDRFGRVVRTKTPDGVWTDVAFDACGRVTFESAPYTTANGVRGVLTAYDALGRITSTSTRDDAGAVTSTTSRAYTGIDVTVTDALTRATTYDYDSDSGPGGGQLVALTDAAGQTTTYTYHVSGALASTGGTVAGTRT